MTRLSDIPVKIERNAPEAGHAIARAVLRDVRAALAAWLATGAPGAVDLKNVPRMRSEEYQYLRDVLATGEVSIAIEAQASVDIRETQYPGVWWVTHRNDQGETVTEIIEITDVPVILKPHAVEVRGGLQRLERVLAEPFGEDDSSSRG